MCSEAAKKVQWNDLNHLFDVCSYRPAKNVQHFNIYFDMGRSELCLLLTGTVLTTDLGQVFKNAYLTFRKTKHYRLYIQLQNEKTLTDIF